MKRVLILCASDWTARRGGPAGHYLHEVGSRIAQEGNFVAWLCSNQRSGPFLKKAQPAMESVDGIQIARLGPRFLYGKVVQIVLSRLRRQGKLAKLYDVILSCVTGSPLDLGEPAGVPVLPVVFALSPKIRGTSEPPSPLIAVSQAAEESLRSAGFPSSQVIRAPFGAPPCDAALFDEKSAETAPAGAERTTLVALTDSPGPVLTAMKSIDKAARPSRVVFVGRKRPRGCDGKAIVWQPHLSNEDRAEFYAAAACAYCGVGYEWEALAVGAAGVPVICAGTAAAAEYVSYEETGLVCPPNDSRGLADSLARLGKDEVLRKRLACRGRERAGATPWDRTAGLVLSAIENLK